MRAAAVFFAAAAASGARAGQSPPAPPPDRAVPISERVKGLERRDGFLPFYWDARCGGSIAELR